MEMTKKKDGRGGARPGAGRKRRFAKKVGVRVPQDVADFIEEQPNQSEYILNCILSDMAQRKAHDLSCLENVLETNEVKFVPMGNAEPYMIAKPELPVAAGTPIWIDNQAFMEKVDLNFYLMKDPSTCLLMLVKGNSMIDANIFSGDMAIIDITRTDVTRDDIALCGLNGEYTIKHVDKDSDGNTILIPDNEEMPPIPVNQFDDFRVWGVVKFTIHKH